LVRFASKSSKLILAAGLVTFAAHVAAADLSLRLSGNLVGFVLDDQGVPQIAANILLFDRFGKLIQKAASAADGHFAFSNLPADVYSIRVSSLDYLPARLDSIAVRPGLDSLLEIHLATLLSSVQLSYSIPRGAMSKDWKWVLRSSPATRLITRFRPEDVSMSQDTERGTRVFSGTHAMLSLSGGDTNVIDPDAGGDLGTGFALSTNILQKNQLEVGGSLAQNGGLMPAAMGLCAIYSRNDGSLGGSLSPEVTFNVTQLGVVAGPGFSPAPGLTGSSIPAVRTMSLSVYQAMDLGGLLHVEYGVTGESVEYLDHTMRISPFARVTTSLGELGEIVASYSDGARPDELRAHQQQTDGSGQAQPAEEQLADAVNTLSRLPQLSYRDGRLQMQRTESYELGYRKSVKSRTYAISGFSESVSNGRVDVAGNTSLLDSGDLMSEGTSQTSVYNIGRFKRTGVIASVDQHVRKSVNLSFAYGRMGGLSTTGGASASSDLGGFLQLQQQSHNVANAALNMKAPKTSTKISTNYGWMDGNAIIPRHVFTTQNTSISPGFNVMVKQPLPSLFGMPGHLELSADLRNLLAQGYLPVDGGGARSLLVVQSPRAIRGGLNFIF
jgi:hypothetical protein